MPIVDPSKPKPKNEKSAPQIAFLPEEPKFSISEMILSEKVKEELDTIVSSSRNWKKVFEKWNLQSVIKGRKSILVNFFGSPGTGKTMAAHAVAKSLEKKVLVVNYADIESKYVGETGKNLVALFDFAKENDVVVFFDEADALLSRRVTDMSHSTDVSVNQTRSVLLNILNDYDGMVLFASNFISNYDPAFMRRIQYHVEFSLPDAALREKLWTRYVPSELPTDLNAKEIAEKYEEISGSEISTAVLRACLKAASKNEETVSKKYFEEAVESIIRSKAENSKKFQLLSNKTKVVSREEVVKNLGEEKVKEIENKPKQEV